MIRVMNNIEAFPQKIKETLYELVGGKCSNPYCQCETKMTDDISGERNLIGRAVYIASVSEEEPRFDSSLTQGRRNSIDNGIWLCELCAKKVESDDSEHSVALLKYWKYQAEYEQEKKLNQKNNMPVQNITLEERREIAYGKIKKALAELHNIVSYAYTYWKQNFRNRVNDAELDNEIRIYYKVYEREFNQIAMYQQKHINLSKVLKEYGTDLDITLGEEVKRYLRFFDVKFQNSDWDGHTDFISHFLIRISKQFNEMDNCKKAIDDLL